MLAWVSEHFFFLIKVILEISGHSSTLLKMGFNPTGVLCVLYGAVFSLLALTVLILFFLSPSPLCCTNQ